MSSWRLLPLLTTFLALAVSSGSAGRAGPGALVIANQFEHVTLLVDLATNKTLLKIEVGINGHEVAVSPHRRFAYVPIYGNSGVGRPGTDGSTIDIIDLRERKFSGTIDLGKPVRPHCAKFGPDGFLYVTAELANAVYVVNTTSHKVIAEIPTGQIESHMLVISPDGRLAYTSNVHAGSVSVLDLKGRKLITTIPVAKFTQRISLSPDGRRVFVHDQDAPRIAVIDTATNKISRWIELPEVAYASTPTPDGQWLLAVSRLGKLHVIEMRSLRISKSFDMPRSSNEVEITPDRTTAYVSCPEEGKIAVLDLRSWRVEDPIRLTPGVDGLAWLPTATN